METGKEISKNGALSDRRPTLSGLQREADRDQSRRADAPRPSVDGTEVPSQESNEAGEITLDAVRSPEMPAADARSAEQPDAAHMDERWHQILADFVDDPRRAVSAAHELVGQSIQTIVDKLNGERAKMEERWSRGTDADTETMRVCLQEYRAFFNRLASLGSP